MGFEPIKSFLIADENSETREGIADTIRHFYKDARIFMAGDGAEAMQKLRNATPSLMIVDLDMSKLAGSEKIEQVNSIEQMQRIGGAYSRIPTIVTSLLDPEPDVLERLEQLHMFFLKKPFKVPALIAIMEGFLNSSSGRVLKIEPLQLKAGETLFREGEASGNMFLVRTGKLRVFKNIDQKTKEIGIIGPNELVGEMAFIDRKPRSATVEAIEASELVELPLTDVHSYLAQQPVWLRALINTLVSRLRGIIDRK